MKSQEMISDMLFIDDRLYRSVTILALLIMNPFTLSCDLSDDLQTIFLH